MKTTTVILCIGSISRSWFYQWHIDSIVIVMDILYHVQANISNNFSSTTKRNYNKSAKQQHIYRIIKVTSKPSRALIHWTVRRLTTRSCEITKPLQWRHIEGDVSNHQSRDCLLNRYLGVDQRKHRCSASLAFMWGIHRWPVNSPHKEPVTRKMFPFDDVIMMFGIFRSLCNSTDVSAALLLKRLSNVRAIQSY